MNNYAGFWIRVAAYLIDTVILMIVGAVLGMIFGVGALGMNFEPGSTDGAAYWGYNLVSLAIGVAYFAGMESSSHQATFGKRALGLIVTDTSGNQISFLRAVGRYFAKILSAIILMIGFIMVGFTERKQGLHDMLASTLVLNGKPGMSGHDTSVFE